MASNKKNIEDKGNQDVYLVIADNTDGFQLALRYATRRSIRVGAHLMILHVMDKEDFQAWGGIQERIHEEHREQAERLLLNAAQAVKEMGGKMPGLYLEEGGRIDVITEFIKNDPHVRRLILGAEANSSNPGPLVDYFTSKGLPSLQVPLTVIPGHLDPDSIDGKF